MTYGDVPQCLGKMALAGAAGADDEHRDLLLQVAASGQIHYLRLVHSEVEGEVVAFKRLLRVDASPALPHDEFALLTASDLVFDEQGQEVGVGELLLHGLTVADLQGVQDAGETELFQVRRELRDGTVVPGAKKMARTHTRTRATISSSQQTTYASSPSLSTPKPPSCSTENPFGLK